MISNIYIVNFSKIIFKNFSLKKAKFKLITNIINLLVYSRDFSQTQEQEIRRVNRSLAALISTKA